MKGFKLAAASFALALCAAALLVMLPDVAFAAPAHSIASGSFFHFDGLATANLVLALGVEALRSQHGELVTRAAAKLAEIKDGLAAADVTRIEGEHAAIVADVNTVATALAAAERAHPSTAPNVAEVTRVERVRANEIIALSARHNMPADFATGHIANGSSIEVVRAAVLTHLETKAPKVTSRVQVGTDEGDTIRLAVADAITLRARPSAISGDTEANRNRLAAARDWRGMRLLEIARTYIEETGGIRLRGLSPMELAGVALGMQTRAGMMTSSDFPNILSNVASKRLRDAYAGAPQNWKLISRQSNAPDFKSRAVLQLSNLPKFKKVREGEEYAMTSLTEAAESYALATYGSIIPISRQTLINDDLSAFDRLPSLQGRAAAETEASIVWGILTANAALADGVALFHATHANLAAAGTAITVAALNAGRAAMRKQTNIAAKAADREPLNVAPKFLLVSPDKETEAQQFLASIIANAAGSVNPFANSLTQITEARLTGNAWYLSADPSQIDTIEYAYLEGEEGLFTETQVGFDIDGIKVKGRIDFAAKAIDYRGLYSNPGA
jgi:hypothetical protein